MTFALAFHADYYTSTTFFAALQDAIAAGLKDGRSFDVHGRSGNGPVVYSHRAGARPTP